MIEQSWHGHIVGLHKTPRAFLPMSSDESLDLVAGRGITGDRYCLDNEQGFYSQKPEEGRQVTLFEAEVLETILRDYKIEILPEEHRRNITTRGVPLNWLVHRRFRVGEGLFEAPPLSPRGRGGLLICLGLPLFRVGNSFCGPPRLSVPCRHIEEILGRAVFN